MSLLFDETAIRGLTIKNRFIRSATWEARATQEGKCTKELADFISELAQGDIGLIILGHAYVLPNGKGTPRQTAIFSDVFLEGLERVSSIAKHSNSRIAIQLSHAGGHTKSGWISGPIISPSPFKNIYGEYSRGLSIKEIRDVVSAYALAGKRAKEAGFSAVQIHAAHGYLINQFLSPVWNERTDLYGGTIENRARFLFEICRQLRKEVGNDFPVLVKLASEDFIEGGLTIKESVWVSKEIAKIGVDAIEVSGGSRYSEPLSHIRRGVKDKKDEAWFADNAYKIKQAVNIPVIIVGGIRSFDVAKKLVETKCADFIAMSRPFICEPHLIRRWQSGDRSRSKCVSDNLCLGPAYNELGLRCETLKRKSDSNSQG